jgi:hypothetical protein
MSRKGMRHTRGRYRGPVSWRKPVTHEVVRPWCARDAYWSQEEIDQAIRAAKQFDAVVGWTGAKEWA